MPEMPEVKLKYGKEGAWINLPAEMDFSVLELKKTPPLKNFPAVFRNRLSNPSGAAALAGLAGNADNACIVVSDKTRFVPYRAILPGILETLEEKNTDVFFLVASGMHAPSTEADAVEILGEEIAGRYRVISHDALDEPAAAYLGTTPSGAPVYVNKSYAEAGLKILTGFIEPHFMAGFSGGRKSVCPGISGVETVKFVHSAKILSSPLAKAGCLEGNPVHAAMSEAAEIAGCDFLINVTLNSDKEITGVFCGGLKEAFAEGVAKCLSECAVSAEGGFDVVVTTGGGYPLDRNFYQTVKGLVGALEIIKPGGELFCAAECSEGLGSDDFREMLYGMKSTKDFMSMIFSEGFFRPDQWEVQELVRVLDKCRVSLYSGLSGAEAEACMARPVADLSGEIIRVAGRGARVAVIPDGPYVLALNMPGEQGSS